MAVERFQEPGFFEEVEVIPAVGCSLRSRLKAHFLQDLADRRPTDAFDPQRLVTRERDGDVDDARW
jgi:hypothetical protein